MKSLFRYFVGLGACAALSAAFACVSFASTDYEYIDEVYLEADIDYESSTDFDVEFSYDEEDWIEEMTVTQLSSTSSTTQKFKIVFTSNYDDDYRFADDVTVTADNVSAITDVTVSSSGKKLTVKVSVKYKSSDTKTKSADGSSSSSSSSSVSTVTTVSGPSSTTSTSTTSSTTGGWTGSGDDWYYRTSSGSYATGWVQDETGWYYCNPSNGGKMMSGWIYDSGYYYYLNEAHDGTYGRMLTGWQVINGSKYYFLPYSGGPLGACVINSTITIDGGVYTFDSTGKCTS